ncbi:U-scoloptoxin(16)-Sm2a-like [Artemia franciscana]|uniref:Single domain-containing protein n=1 Tax=Artemia franciscana TaxID=6661 RepID=A0AA88LG54_ARTSF|nr:hypothetical protein QYM36_000172 [Artemia franciscana]
MKTILVFVAVVAVAIAQQPSTRVLPADVLRDFPGVCFASTSCKTHKVGEKWSLAPFCGISECIKGDDGKLLEKVSDCGPLPKPNNKCKLSPKTNLNATFPDCCPKFDCEPGVKLEF